MAASSKTRTLAVDLKPLMLAGLRVFARRSQTIRLMGECTASEAAYSILNSRGIDVILVDISHSAQGALEILKMLERRSLECKVLLLSSDQGDGEALKLVRAGAVGCITIGMNEDQLIRGIVSAGRGERTFPPHLGWMDGKSNNNVLSPRQAEVVHLVATGRSNKEIGTLLGISSFTVRNQVRLICLKLKASDRTEAAIVAMRRGIIHISSDEIACS